VPCRVVSASSASSSIASIGPGIQADRRSRVWRRQGMEAVISGVGLLPNGARCGGSASSCVPGSLPGYGDVGAGHVRVVSGDAGSAALCAARAHVSPVQ
jgi:hypothetical protein